MPARSISIHDAKIELCRLLKDVERGLEIIITNRGKPVGRIVPVGEEALTANQWVENLERQGILEPVVNRKPRGLPPALPIQEGLAQRFLEESRAR